MTGGLLVSTKCMTAFTQEYLSLISDYSRVLSARKDSLHKYVPLVGYYSQVQNCMTGVTRKYFQLINNRSQAVRVFLVSHEPNTQVKSKISQGTTRHTCL